FAVWDEPRRTLFLARDRVGKKPLFYAVAGGQLVFASELQGLVQHPHVSRDLDLQSLDEYLTYGYIPAPPPIYPRGSQTPPGPLYRRVYKLPPAHHLECRVGQGGPGELRVERYWQLAYSPKQTLTEDEAVAGLLEVLTEAVRLRLIADVPLGALLSGGVDSS